MHGPSGFSKFGHRVHRRQHFGGRELAVLRGVRRLGPIGVCLGHQTVESMYRQETQGGVLWNDRDGSHLGGDWSSSASQGRQVARCAAVEAVEGVDEFHRL